MSLCCQKRSDDFLYFSKEPLEVIGMELRGGARVERYFPEEQKWGISGTGSQHFSWEEFRKDLKDSVDSEPQDEFKVFTKPTANQEATPAGFSVAWERGKGWGVRSDYDLPRNAKSLFRTVVSEGDFVEIESYDPTREHFQMKVGALIDTENFRKKYKQKLGAPFYVNASLSKSANPNVRFVIDSSRNTIGITKLKDATIKKGDFLTLSYGGSAGKRLTTAENVLGMYHVKYADGKVGVFASEVLEKGTELGVYANKAWRDRKLKYLRTASEEKGGGNSIVDEDRGTVFVTEDVQVDEELILKGDSDAGKK